MASSVSIWSYVLLHNVCLGYGGLIIMKRKRIEVTLDDIEDTQYHEFLDQLVWYLNTLKISWGFQELPSYVWEKEQ